MDSFSVAFGKPVYHPAGQQPDLVLVDAFNGQVVFVRKTEPGEDIEELMEQAKRMRKLRLLTIDRNGKHL